MNNSNLKRDEQAEEKVCSLFHEKENTKIVRPA